MTNAITPQTIPAAYIIPKDLRTSYLVPEEDLTLAERVEWRSRISAQLYSAAIQQNIKNAASLLVLRDTLPSTDLYSVNGNIPQTTEDWLITAAGVAGTYLTYVNQAVPQTKTFAFYGIGFLGPSLPKISVFQAFQGPNTNYGYWQTELLEFQLRPVALFSEEFYYGQNQTMILKVMPRTGAFPANDQRVFLRSLCVEPLGDHVSASST